MKPIAAFVFCVAAVASLNASASIVTGGTRVIFDGSHQAASLSVENSDKVTNLVQSWVSPAEGSALKKETMIITPPLFRLEAGKKNVDPDCSFRDAGSGRSRIIIVAKRKRYSRYG